MAKKIKIGESETDLSVNEKSILGTSAKIELPDLRDGFGLEEGMKFSDVGKVIFVGEESLDENNPDQKARLVRFDSGLVISSTAPCWNSARTPRFDPSVYTTDEAMEKIKSEWKAFVANYKSPYRTEKAFLTDGDWTKLVVGKSITLALVSRFGGSYTKTYFKFSK